MSRGPRTAARPARTTHLLPHPTRLSPDAAGADASKGPPPEKQVSLTGANAPRLGNRNGTPDQPFAWAAREFLRKQMVGKRVTFRVESVTPSGREMGSVYLEDGSSVALLLVSNGWAKAKSPHPNDPPSAEADELAGAARAAEEQQLGIWAPQTEAAVRTVQWANTFDANELLAKVKGKAVDAVIEQAGAPGARTLPREHAHCPHPLSKFQCALALRACVRGTP